MSAPPEPQPRRPHQPDDGPAIDFTSSISRDSLGGANVLITGGASGLGKSCANAFLSHGAYVTIADIEPVLLDGTKAELLASSSRSGQVQTVVCNVTEWESQVKLFQAAARFGLKGVIDVVLPFAGPGSQPFTYPKPGNDVVPESLSPPPIGCMSVALIGMTYTCQLAVHYMHNQSRSLRCLIVIGSMASYNALPGSCDYSAAKYGARGIFKSLRDAPEIRGTPLDSALRVNMIAPGFILTPMTNPKWDTVISAGIKEVPIEALLDGILRVAADSTIYGKAIGVASDGPFDLLDSQAGLNGVTASRQHSWRTGDGV
ncbi:hypothetical protein PMZ80_009194 [Knufia obscura]|uniref:Uncharacterized protein n=2 Tax=Knufia TaxID=430999 RepID=A0AAN8EGH3_9EURO|nr:hypothetical protein PMZ80_009194 [Knufia obscura]KAK5949065.1 hypothetical protein OHC33_009986 [Knufia fluminis]